MRYLLVLLLVGCVELPAAPEYEYVTDAELTERQLEIAQVTNEHRRQAGCTVPLERHPLLEQAAWAHAKDMESRGYFGHVTPEGRTLRDRLDDVGFFPYAAGENIARGYYGGVEKVFQGWLDSPAHKENLERCGWRYQGYAISGRHHVHLFSTK